LNPDPAVTRSCEKSFSDANGIAICVRAHYAGLSAGRLALAIGGSAGDVSFNRPDSTQVSETNVSYPSAQCRLDTMMAGAVCQAALNDEPSSDSVVKGVCAEESGFTLGVRPHCWYKPSGGVVNPPPPTGTASAPLLNGQTTLSGNNPNSPITVSWNVMNIASSDGVYLEVTRPNTPFSNPNDYWQDPYALTGSAIEGRTGQVSVTPMQYLPGWGTYYLRVIPLKDNGYHAAGRASNPAELRLYP
jgi:hypothetical protein